MLKLIFSPRMLVSFLMGFSCGVPLLLTLSVLQAWMKEEGVDLSVIGLFSLVGLPYTLKFLWAPILDRFTLPLFGRRRGWLLLFQMLLALAIAGLGMSNPATNPWLVAGAAFLVTFFPLPRISWLMPTGGKISLIMNWGLGPHSMSMVTGWACCWPAAVALSCPIISVSSRCIS